MALTNTVAACLQGGEGGGGQECVRCLTRYINVKLPSLGEGDKHRKKETKPECPIVAKDVFSTF